MDRDRNLPQNNRRPTTSLTAAETPVQTTKTLEGSVWIAIAWGMFPVAIAQPFSRFIALVGFGPSAINGTPVLSGPRQLLLQFGILGLTLAGTRATHRWRWRDLIGPKNLDARVWLGATVLAIGAGAFIVGGAKLLSELIEISPPAGERLRSLPAGVFVGVVVAPILEESLYRGVLLRVLLQRFGARYAIAFSASLFALIHFDLSLLGFASLLLSGSIFGWLLVRSKSLLPAVVAHASWNLTMICLALASANQHPVVLVLGGAALAVVGAHLVAPSLGDNRK